MNGFHERAAQVLADLARSADVETRDVRSVLVSIAETAARTLELQRVNVWLYDPNRRTITCVEDYDLERGDHLSGAQLTVTDAAAYFDALDHLRGVVAFDTHGDPRMAGLRPYLRAHGVTAMLDVPLIQSGRVIGVVCHEHVGAPRAFDEWELAFAGAIGDLVSLVLESDRRVHAEREQRALAEQLARVRRVDSLGWVAAGVAHDLRNLLTIVFTNVDLLRAGRGDPAAALDHVDRAAGRARDLCSLLLESSGPAPVNPEVVDVAACVRDIVQLVDTQAAPVAVSLDLAPGTPPVLGERAAVQRVVLNLLTNALESLPPDGGRVTVRVRAEVPRAPTWDFRDHPRPATVLVEVDDDGRGMDEGTAQRCFEPFFSTKGTSGAGFGLATVLGAVRGHHGAVDLRSTPGVGTSVRVWFPIAPRSAGSV